MRSPRDGVVRCLGLTLLVLALLGPIVWSWYVTWGVVVLAPAAVGRLRTALIVISTFWAFAGVTSVHNIYVRHDPHLLLARTCCSSPCSWRWRSCPWRSSPRGRRAGRACRGSRTGRRTTTGRNAAPRSGAAYWPAPEPAPAPAEPSRRSPADGALSQPGRAPTSPARDAGVRRARRAPRCVPRTPRPARRPCSGRRAGWPSGAARSGSSLDLDHALDHHEAERRPVVVHAQRRPGIPAQVPTLHRRLARVEDEGPRRHRRRTRPGATWGRPSARTVASFPVRGGDAVRKRAHLARRPSDGTAISPGRRRWRRTPRSRPRSSGRSWRGCRRPPRRRTSCPRRSGAP